MKFIYNMKMQNTVYTITVLYIGRFIYDQINRQLANNTFFDIQNIVFWCSLVIILLFFLVLFILVEKYMIIYIYEKNIILNFFYVFLLSIGSYSLINILLPLLEDVFLLMESVKTKFTVEPHVPLKKDPQSENLIKSEVLKDPVSKEVTKDELLKEEIVKDDLSKEVIKEEILKNEIPKEIVKEEQPNVFAERDRLLCLDTRERRMYRPMVGPYIPDIDDHEEYEEALAELNEYLSSWYDFFTKDEHVYEIVVEKDDSEDSSKEENSNFIYYLFTGAINIIRYTCWPLFGEPKTKKVTIKEVKDT